MEFGIHPASTEATLKSFLSVESWGDTVFGWISESASAKDGGEQALAEQALAEQVFIRHRSLVAI